MSNPSIFWIDRVTYSEMLYQGHLIRFADLKDAVNDIHGEAIRVWEEEVLMGLLIRVNYERIADNMTDRRVGYSCFRDARNECFMKKGQLWKAVLTSDRLRDKFLRLSADGSPVWNRSALSQWLQSYARFSGLQMASAEMTAGSASRATELHSMNACNTKCRSSRNALAMGDHLVLMVRYTKTGSIQKHDRLIPHALDAITTDLMIQDQAIARPFARKVVRILFPNDADMHLMYSSLLFVNGCRPFDTDDLTKILGKFTQHRTGLWIGVRSWRQISIGFRKKRSASTMELYTRLIDGVETIDCRMRAHTGVIDRLHYAVSTDDIAGAPPEDVLPLYLDASVEWQVDLGIVPGERVHQVWYFMGCL
jgi:hypothetical protein